MLFYALRSLIPEDNTSLARRTWEFHDEVPLIGQEKRLFIAIGVVSILSMVSSLSLLLFLTYRFIYWKRYYSRPLAKNQYVILIYNLLLVDLQQAIAFLMCLYWASKGSVHYGEPACYLQGWWIMTADPGSGLFVLAIAIHTGAIVLRGRQLPFHIFVWSVIALWGFILVLGFIPVGLYGNKAFVISEANWCWLSPEHETERLWGHYIWIFISEFGTILLYAFMSFYLHRQIKQAKILHAGQQENLQRLKRVVFYMVVYPVVYVVLSLPLAAGRMATAKGFSPNKTYFGVAGCLMALSGFFDVMVYTLTRRHLLLNTEPSTTDHEHTDSQGKSRTTTEGGSAAHGNRSRASRIAARFSKSGHQANAHAGSQFDNSTENIVSKHGMELSNFGVYQETTIEISHEPASAYETEGQRARRQFSE